MSFSNNTASIDVRSSPLPRELYPSGLADLGKQMPKELFFSGNLELLNPAYKKVAIVGTRSPNPYTKSFVSMLSRALCANNAVVLSGGALGVDITAHEGAMPRTIMFSPSSLEIIYPKNNQKAIERMHREALVLSEYDSGYMPRAYSFLERNRLVIASSDVVVIPQADVKSGSSNSAQWAKSLGRPIFVLPHRLGESSGTNLLLAQNKARAIYDINDFVSQIVGERVEKTNDEILEFCSNNPSFEEAFNRFGAKIYEYELDGKIKRERGCVCVV